MGLGGQKRRNKLSQDPNNTQWSKSTDTYGHKILSAQGWKPGDYLGAENASHSDHFTSANASHIRVLLREDNLGLGAQVGKVNAQTFGLSLFSSVLGRLNGKSDAEVQKHQNALRDAELRTYQAQKYGNMNFVSGGFIVGDRLESSPGEAPLSERHEASAISETSEVLRANKKRASVPTPTEPESKKRKKRPARKTLDVDDSDESQLPQDIPQDAAENMDEARVKVKKQKKSKSDRKAQAVDEDITEEDERSRRKHERRAHKEERRRRKEEKRTWSSNNRTLKAESARDHSGDNVAPTTGTKQSRNMFAGNRHAVRQRYIQQKRMAALDPQAMKEIFMLKPTATAA